MRNIILLISLLFIYTYIYSQEINAVDSLQSLLKYNKVDSEIVSIYADIAWEYAYNNPDSAFKYANKGIHLAEKMSYHNGIAYCKIIIGALNESNGMYQEAISEYKSALAHKRIIGDSVGVSACFNNIGLVYIELSDFDKALEYYLKSLEIKNTFSSDLDCATTKLNIGRVYFLKGLYKEASNFYFEILPVFEKNNYLDGIATAYTHIALLYEVQEQDSISIEYHKKALHIYSELNDLIGTAGAYTNIGLLNIKNEKLEEASDNINNAMSIFTKVNNIEGIAISYNNLALISEKNRNHKDAIANYKKSIYYEKISGNLYGELQSHNAIGTLYLDLNDFENAKMHLDTSLSYAEKVGSLNLFKDVNDFAFLYYEKIGDTKNALRFHKQARLYNDSIFQKETNKQIAEMQSKYESEKKQKEIELLQKDAKVKDLEHKKLYVIIYSFTLGFFIILIFSILLYRLFIQKKKAYFILEEQNIEIIQKNEEIESQRDEISAQRELVTLQKEKLEEIHEELTDSITYAKRIQEAVLPVSKESRSILGEHFILFKPKDIVSGDFYWVAEINRKLIIAIADCTGHGVPGAFMSMLGISFLNEIVRKKEITKANHILNQLRWEIVNALQQKGEEGEQKDGMDLSLIVINKETNSLEFSAANNPLYLIRRLENYKLKDFEIQSLNLQIFESLNSTLIEIKGDKMPIAIHLRMDEFTNHEIKLEKDDCIYLFSDGYADQFGGEKGKKFMYKNFKEILISNSHLTMEEQKAILENKLITWMGNLEQIDDITVLGIKI